MTLYYRYPKGKWQTTTIEKLDKFIKGEYPKKYAINTLKIGNTLYTPKVMLRLVSPERTEQENLFQT